MSRLIASNQPCPCGKSSDAYAVYDDGHGFCYSCSKNYQGEMEDLEDNADKEFVSYAYEDIRGLTKETCEAYDIITKRVEGEVVGLGFTHPNGAVKLRRMDGGEGPRWVWIKNGKNEVGKGLYGLNIFDPGTYETLTIVEGHPDAPSLFQASGKKEAVVSVQSSSSAVRDIRENFDKVNAFKRIVLCFDNDVPGKRAVKSVAAMFDPNKVFNVTLSRHKDANEYVVNGESKELMGEWYDAKKFTPDEFIHTFPEIRRSLTESVHEVVGTYPLPYLQNALRGLLRGELVVFKGMEGIGKTEFFRATEHHILKNHPETKIGLIHMEEDKSITIRGIATYEEDSPMYFHEDGTSDEDVFESYKKAVGEKDDRVYIYKIRSHDNPDEILTSIRVICAVSGVDIIFLDNLQKLVETIDEDSERRKLVYLASKLKSLAEDLKICIPIISHVNVAGGSLGSGWTTKIADKVIHMHRDMKSTDPIEKNTTYFDIEKGRLIRTSEDPNHMIFDPVTYTLKAEE